MAIVNTTIGVTGRTYSTVDLWNSNDGGGDGLGNDDCTGSMYDDDDFDENVTINFNANSIVLTVAAGEEHDGTPGTGVRILKAASTDNVLYLVVPGTIRLVEVDNGGNGQGSKNGRITGTGTGGGGSVMERMLIHNVVEPSHQSKVVETSVGTDLHNCMLFNQTNTNTGSRTARGVYRKGNVLTLNNTTVHGVTNNGGTGIAYGVDVSATTKNCIATDTGGTTTGEKKDYNATTMSYSLSSDTSASGTGSLTEKASSAQFVSNTAPYDLHLKVGADAIDAGDDLATTPAGVQFDIDGRDRDTEEDVWDMGADEYEAVVGGVIIPSIMTTPEHINPSFVRW